MTPAPAGTLGRGAHPAPPSHSTSARRGPSCASIITPRMCQARASLAASCVASFCPQGRVPGHPPARSLLCFRFLLGRHLGRGASPTALFPAVRPSLRFPPPPILHTCGRDRFLSLSHHVCLSWVAILSLVSCERLGGWGSRWGCSVGPARCRARGLCPVSVEPHGRGRPLPPPRSPGCAFREGRARARDTPRLRALLSRKRCRPPSLCCSGRSV